jgi:hypothetical protein
MHSPENLALGCAMAASDRKIDFKSMWDILEELGSERYFNDLKVE